ncbi:MAG: NAD(P)(+) transhydrogenase (Re/Si-specific) subunit beta [Puniceicoccaceae bacterium]
MSTLVPLAYVVASILFILGIKMLGSAKSARQGNRLSGIGMLLAVTVTLIDQKILTLSWIIPGILIGAAIGVVWAKRVEMTGMPELVALFNGFGGGASLLVGWAEYVRAFGYSSNAGLLSIGLATLIGGVTFTGSGVAFGKLSEKLAGAPLTFPSQRQVNFGLIAGSIAALLLFIFVPNATVSVLLFIVILVAALAFGVTGTLPIGGGDMPVVIALLNSLSGLAAAAAGFAINNQVLVVAGCLVGASGLILTVIMCKAMNRSLVNVLLGGFGGTTSSAGGSEASGEMKAISVEDAYYLLEAAENVIFVPGYGMAVAQAQHAVKELSDALVANGCEVRFAIHPVAGRMPGHMNVLLAEADVDYDQLVEMDDVNPTISLVDVAIVVGANDVVNPAAADDQSSPIYGMPIINVHEAKTVFCLKRGKGTGFSGLQNSLFFRPNTRMIFGDAKSTLSALVTEFKDK